MPARYLWPIPAAALLILYFHPPCPIHALTGLLCPGCGATRALTALLHGHLTQAFHLNPLVVVLLPIALAFTLRPRRIPTPAIYFILTVTAAFTILRNLP